MTIVPSKIVPAMIVLFAIVVGTLLVAFLSSVGKQVVTVFSLATWTDAYSNNCNCLHTDRTVVVRSGVQ